MDVNEVVIKRATSADAKAVSEIISAAVEEGKYTAMRMFTEPEERAYIESLSERETIFIAEVSGKAIGIQTIDTPCKWSDKMDHVGMMGTFILEGYRSLGIGKLLAKHTLAFAQEHGYEKIIIMVMSDNDRAVRYYESIGFIRVGIHRKHVKLGCDYKDEVAMELFL
jgi:ribosomal protein S18 acetylase RimI-like enzyme